MVSVMLDWGVCFEAEQRGNLGDREGNITGLGWRRQLGCA